MSKATLTHAEALANHLAEEQEHNLFLALYEIELEEAIAQDVAGGKHAPYRPGSKSFQLKERRDKAVDRLEKLPSLIAFHRKKVDAENEERRATSLGDLRERLDDAHLQESIRWSQFADAFKAFFDSYMALAETAQVYGDLYREGASMGLGDRDHWRKECQPVAKPFPADFMAGLHLLVSAAIDPHGNGVYGSNATLAKMLPDLRPVYRHPKFPAGLELIYKENQAQRGKQPIGYSNHLAKLET